MKSLPLLLLSALALPACGGGATPPATMPTAAPTAAPNASPTPKVTITPSPAPSATASPAATPTAVPLSQRVIGGAPLTATASQLSSARRTAQAHTEAQGVENGLPILVESSGMVAAWAGDVGVWTTNAQTQANIPETGLTVTPSGTLPINNPGPQPLSCLASTSGICVVHPTAWTFGTSSANGKPVGQQTITVTFADGTTGTTYDDVYDGWNLPCNAGWAYVNGVPVAQATRATSDVYADCVAGNIVFPHGGMLFLNPTQDQYGRYETILPSVIAAINIVSFQTNFAMPTISQGQVYAIATQDGGFAKVYFGGPAGSISIDASSGMSLHAAADGTYPF
jgi:hypothetical protein